MFVRLLPPDGGGAAESSLISHAQFMQEQNLLDVWSNSSLIQFLIMHVFSVVYMHAVSSLSDRPLSSAAG